MGSAIDRAAALPLLGLVFVLLAGDARADGDVTIATPIGWSTRDPDDRARERAASWLVRRSDAHLRAVITPDSEDDFPEVLATIELDGPYDQRNTEQVELERALERLMPYAAEQATTTISEAQPDRPRLIRASWTSASIAYRVALVPSGTTRTLVVLATLDSEAPLYERTFEQALAGLQGASAPRLPFDHGRWRMLALLGWFVPAALLLGAAVWRRPLGLGMVWVGRGLALLFFTAALIAGWVVHGRMLERSDELRLAGLSAEAITTETISYGIGVAVICWVVGAVLATRERPVDSAPTSGAFAGRSASESQVQIPVIPIIPKIGPREQQVPRHPDGPSRLDPVTDPPGGSLRAIDPGVEPRDPQ